MKYEGVPGQVAVKASGGVSERPPIKGCNDVAVDRFGQACRFLASFRLPFALRGSSGEAITDEAWGLGPGKVRWHTVRSREPELPILKVRFFIGARISFSRMCAVTQIIQFIRNRFWRRAHVYERQLHDGSFDVQHSMRRCASQSLGQFAATAIVTCLASTLHTLLLSKSPTVAAKAKVMGARA